VGRLPYGLQKRVELGRALAMEPDLLLLDEPMAGMNLEEKEDMSRFILDVNDQIGTTIALIEHDMGVVMDLSTGWWCSITASKIADGTPDEVSEQPGRDRRLSGRAALMETDKVDILYKSSSTRSSRWSNFRTFCCRCCGKASSPARSLRADRAGFVLIFKASGVFNFAQGIMVVFAALTLVGLHEERACRPGSALILTIGVSWGCWRLGSSAS
jgi:ABC-type multidrug transport system ATPase subunit